MSLTICFFGTYKLESGYPVNRYLLKGLRDAGCEVQECREKVWEGFLHEELRWRIRDFASMAWLALKGYVALVRKYKRVGSHQCVIIGYPGFLEVIIGRMLNLFGDRLVVLVSFISLYDTVVVDREQIEPGSWRAVLLKAVDRLAFKAANVVLADTHEQIRHYAELFGIPEGKFQRSFVGHEFHDYEPELSMTQPEGMLRVLFYGTYVSLHGIDVILDAASRLEHEREISFTLIGRGQLFEALESSARELTNVKLVDRWLATDELVESIRAADLCLGIFGRSSKAARVIPYKVFGAIALRKAVVTRDSPAIREFLRDDESALLCEPDGSDLAQSISRAHADRSLLKRVADGAYRRYIEHGSPVAVGRSLLPTLEPQLAS